MEPNISTAVNEASANRSQAASASNAMQGKASAAAPDAGANQESQSRISDVVVVGAGPAGMTSALYMARAGFRTLVLEALVPGGQLTSIDELENYPGFGGGVNGYEIAMAMQKQAERFGVQFAYETATALEHSKDPAEEGGKKLFKITTNSGVVLARSVIIATGAKPLKLPQIDSDFLEGKGLSYCATCDGNFYRGKDVVIVGGGDTACAEAIYLARICRKVYVVHRREDFRAHFWYAEKVKHLPNVEIFWNSEIANAVLSPQERIESVVIRNVNTGEEHNLPVEGLFVAIGSQPESQWVRGAVKLDKYGYVEAKSDCHTSLKGVYAAGDVRTTPLRQVVTATADGALAAEAAVAYLSK